MKYYNDYELLYLISEEDEIAKDILKRKYAPLIYEKAKEYYQGNSYNIPSFSFDELIALANDTLLRVSCFLCQQVRMRHPGCRSLKGTT